MIVLGEAVSDIVGILANHLDAEPWETCLACGCLCKPTEVCPCCTAQRIGALTWN